MTLNRKAGWMADGMTSGQKAAGDQDFALQIDALQKASGLACRMITFVS
jgi:hypothetical protein